MTDPIPPKVQRPFTIPFSIRAGTGIVEDAAGLKLGDYGNAKTAQWLCDRLNAPASASHGEREAFEAWARLPGKARINLGRFESGAYHLQSTQDAWLAYQAALQSRATLPGTQDARAAAEIASHLGDAQWRSAEGVESVHSPRAKGLMADIITKHHTPSGPASNPHAFINEYGREVEIRVNNGVHVVISGPDSRATLDLTPREAERLQDALGEHFGLAQRPPSEPCVEREALEKKIAELKASGPAALTEEERKLLDSVGMEVAHDDFVSREQVRDLYHLARRLTPEGSAAKEKTE